MEPLSFSLRSKNYCIGCHVFRTSCSSVLRDLTLGRSKINWVNYLMAVVRDRDRYGGEVKGIDASTVVPPGFDDVRFTASADRGLPCRES